MRGLLGLLVVALTGSCAWAQCAGRIVLASLPGGQTGGKASIERDGEASAAKEGRTFEAGATIGAEAGGGVALLLLDDTTVVLAPGALLRVEGVGPRDPSKCDEGSSRLALLAGAARVRSGRRRGLVEVAAGDMLVSGRGSDSVVRLSGGGDISVAVAIGEGIDVASKARPQDGVHLAPGRGCILKRGEPPSPAIEADSSEFESIEKTMPLPAPGDRRYNRPPELTVVATQGARAGRKVVLDASASSDPDGDALTLKCEQISGPKAGPIELAGMRGVFLPHESGVYVLRPAVGDGLAEAAGRTTVRVAGANRPPSPAALPGGSLAPGRGATLDSSASADPDGDAIVHIWSQTGGPKVELSGRPGAPVRGFTPTGPGVYVFRLYVSDTEAVGGPVDVIFYVDAPAQGAAVAPVALVRAPAAVAVGRTAALDGTGSYSRGAEPGLRYYWRQLSGPAVPEASDRAKSSQGVFRFKAKRPGRYRFELLVEQGELRSEPAAVELALTQDDRVPVADAGADQEASTGSTVVLDGSRSADPGGRDLVYMWTQTDGPEEAHLRGGGASGATPTFVPGRKGTYRFKLSVTNGIFESEADPVDVSVTREGANQPPTAEAGDGVASPLGSKAVLNGSRSADPEGGELKYRWEQTEGPKIFLAGADGPVAYFWPAAKGGYRFRLTVADPSGAQATDEVDVDVRERVGVGMGVPSKEPERSGGERPPDSSALDRSVTLSVRDRSIGDLANDLTVLSGVSIGVSPDFLTPQEFRKHRVTMSVKEMPLRGALDWAARQLGCFWRVTPDGWVWLTTGYGWLLEESPEIRTYQVEGLYAREDGADLVSMVGKVLRPVLEERKDATVTFDARRRLLVAVAPESAHRRMERLFSALRSPYATPSGAPAEDRRTEEALRRIVSFSGGEADLAAIAQDLASQAGVDIGFDLPGNGGALPRVKLSAAGVPLSLALRELAKGAGYSERIMRDPGAGLWLAREEKGGAAATGRGVLWDEALVAAYPIAAIEEKGLGPAVVLRLVRGQIAPECWDDRAAVLEYSPSCRRLVVVNRPRIQADVASFLDFLADVGYKYYLSGGGAQKTGEGR